MLIGSAAIAQLESPKPDKPSGYTENYGFRLYNSGSYPGADSLNQNVIDIDREIQTTRTYTFLTFLGLVIVMFVVGFHVNKRE